MFNSPVVSKIQTDALKINFDENENLVSNFERAIALFKSSDKAKLHEKESSDKSPDVTISSITRTLLSKNRKPSIKFTKRSSHFYDSSEINFDSEITGVFIIVRGVCKVVNRFDNYEVWEVLKGDWFGEWEPLKIWDYTYFGDIYAKSDTEVLFISYEDFQRIPLYEIEKIIPTLIGRNESVFYTMSRKYKTKLDEHLKF